MLPCSVLGNGIAGIIYKDVLCRLHGVQLREMSICYVLFHQILTSFAINLEFDPVSTVRHLNISKGLITMPI